jgi:trigger factor
MKITRESTGELTATIRVEVSQQDYEEKVNKVLKDFQHKANIPGFRPGKVPFGMIRKMYGKATVADEVNKLLSESLAGYLKDENLDILGNPLPNHEKNANISFDTQDSFDFYFDIGVAPEINLTLSDQIEVDRHIIVIDDTMLNHYIEDTRRNYGETTHPEQSGEGDILSGEIIETENGTPVENGIRKTIRVNPLLVTKKESRKLFLGLAKDSKLTINPGEFFGNSDEAVKVLTIAKEKAEQENIAFDFIVTDIMHVEPAALDKELFEKIYPGKEIETEEQFREEVRKDASNSFLGETDKLFFNQATHKLLDEAALTLPDDFLKRWLIENRDAKITPKDIEDEYPSFAESTRWQLIENKILMDNNVQVEEAEVRNYIKSYFIKQIPMPGDDPEVDSRYDSLVDTVMKNEEQVRKLYNELYNAKMLELLKTKLSVNTKEVSYEEFVKLASQNHVHDHDHEHEHEH